MSVEELIQLMRTCSLAKVRAELEELNQPAGNPVQDSHRILCKAFVETFYIRASKRKEK